MSGKALRRRGYDSIPEIETFLNKCYSFRRNSVLDRTEYRKKDSEHFSLLSDRDINSIFRSISHENIRCTISTVRNILHSDFIPDFDPFIEYFEGLPDWAEDQEDYIQLLANTIETVSDPDEWKKALKKWLVGVVACAINPKAVNHQVLVLVGKQGLGKTRWLNSLLPEALKGYLYSGNMNPSNKDALVNLSENLLINLDELETLNKTELGSLKALITQEAIRLRKAYGITNDNFIRRASFMGSVNDAEFLTDTTGNRRYLCFACNSIDADHGVSMDNVFSQAYALYKSGFRYWFNQEETAKIESANEAFLRISLEEESLLKYFDKPIDLNQGKLMTTSEIALYLKDKLKSDFTNATALRKLGQALSKHKFPRTSTRSSKPYRVVLKDGGIGNESTQRGDDPKPEDYSQHIATTRLVPLNAV